MMNGGAGLDGSALPRDVRRKELLLEIKDETKVELMIEVKHELERVSHAG